MGYTLDKIIDIHTHIWDRREGIDIRAEDQRTLISMADRFDLEGLVVMPLFGGHCPSPDQITAGNDAVRLFAQADERIWPFVTIWPPNLDNALEELSRRIEEQNFYGVKVWVCHADHPKMFPVAEKVIEYGKPILIHALAKATGQLPLESNPVHIANLARRYPELQIIMAHMGGDFIFGCNAIADCPNVVTDISGSYCESGMVEYGVKMLGAERVLFGSDAPAASFINNLAKVMTAQIEPAERCSILHDNAYSLLKTSLS